MKRTLVVLIAAAAAWGQAPPADAPKPEVAGPAPTTVAAAPAKPPVAGGGSISPALPVTASAPLPGTPVATDRGNTPDAPVDRIRYAAPSGPAPQVGYAPQAGAPLPGYPGIPATAGGAPGYPSEARGTGPLTSLFTDLKACRPGDVLTIVITQQAVAAANASKESGRQAGVDFDGGAGVLRFLPGFGMNLSTSSTGSTKDTSNFSVATTFTVTVVETSPNGNLVVEGQQVVNLDGRDQWVKLRGEVRPYDVKPDNTVESTRVANVKIEFVGTRARQKRKGVLDFIGGALESLFGLFF